MADIFSSPSSVPIICVLHPTPPNTPCRLESQPVVATPEDSVIQPGAQVYSLPDPLPGVLTKIKWINVGGYGTIYQGVWTLARKDPIHVAIKCIRWTHLGDEDDPQSRERFERRIRRETAIWQMTNHKNILPFYGYQIIDEEPMLVSPWCKNGSLMSYVSQNSNFPDVDKLKLLRDAACGLAYLHSLQPTIIHGDIKPDNVIITDDIVGSLCDFGISRVVKSLVADTCLTTSGHGLETAGDQGKQPFIIHGDIKPDDLDINNDVLGPLCDFGVPRARASPGTHTGLTTSGHGPGTAGYQAKELYDENPRPTTMSDVYAFGGLILATMSGKAPFYKMYGMNSTAPIIMAICSDKTPLPADHVELPEGDPLWGLLQRSWEGNPEQRPSIAYVVEEIADTKINSLEYKSQASGEHDYSFDLESGREGGPILLSSEPRASTLKPRLGSFIIDPGPESIALA
ncbi:hypothetical protein FRC00_000854 [Tulasnella sp. 408]|nr:hypothetical protein FRC00_000854 [Tulasnella sp. 408]